jgi:hypothetical protein
LTRLGQVVLIQFRDKFSPRACRRYIEGDQVADYTPYQRKIIDRYYKNLDAIQFQRLAELATDLYLAEGKKRDQLWRRVEQGLRKLEFPESRIERLLEKRDPALLVEILKELEGGG